jgi:hypothetical protein
MLPRCSSQNDGIPSSSSSLPGSSSCSLYMGNCLFHPGSYGGPSGFAPEQGGIDLTRHIGQPFVPDYTGGVAYLLPTMASPCPPIMSTDAQLVLQDSSHHDSYNNNIPLIGPHYFQDPILLPRPSFYPYHPISLTGVLDHNQYPSTPVDHSSTIVLAGSHGTGSPDFLSQGCQVSFSPSMPPCPSASHFVSTGCQLSSFTPSSHVSLHKIRHHHETPMFSSQSTDPILIKEKVKLTLPTFDKSKVEWSDYAAMICVALCKCNMSYLSFLSLRQMHLMQNTQMNYVLICMKSSPVLLFSYSSPFLLKIITWRVVVAMKC